jgi:hypothetical protein
MSEPIQKLFTTRAEQYPEPTAADVAQGTARAALAAIPFVGGSITEVLSLVLAPAVARRRDTWLKELADGLEEAERKIGGFTVENLVEDEAFVSSVIQATRIAIGTHQEKKREYLRNALINIALGKTTDELLQQMFLNAVEAFSAAHVQALNVIWRGFSGANSWATNNVPLGSRTYGTAIEITVPDLKSKPHLVSYILTDLRNHGFSNLGGPEAPFPQGMPATITNAGIEFLRFVLSDKELP